MKKQLKDLVALQELDALLGELGEASAREREQALGFALGETDRLRAERARLANGLRPEILARYETVRHRHARAVVPASQGVCMGCFTRRPTAMATSLAGGLELCERCGRILFRIEATESTTAGDRRADATEPGAAADASPPKAATRRSGTRSTTRPPGRRAT